VSRLNHPIPRYLDVQWGVQHWASAFQLLGVKKMTLGFIGTGTITEAVVRGLCHQSLPKCTITVSPRGAENAKRLAQTFDNVRIAANNQDVVDSSDIVFLALRPQVAEPEIRALRFKANQRVVSFVSTLSRELLQSWVSVPIQITQAVPLPFVGVRLGTTVIYPPNPDVAALFNQLGTSVEVSDPAELELLQTASALMGTYFGLLEKASEWLQSKGLQSEDAIAYLRQLYAGLANALATSDEHFSALRKEFSTKGGLNEQLFDVFSSQGGLTALHSGLDAVLDRIKKNRPAAIIEAPGNLG
jgi:pyrroline-5-carboxylate reductase